jgi:multiple sugar transport system permease protein
MRDSLRFRLVRAAVLLFLLAFVMLPLYVSVSSAFKPLAEVSGGAFHWIPSRPTLQPLTHAWADLSLGPGFENSAVVTVVATVILVPLAVGAAFVLSRYVFVGRRVFLVAMISTQVFPGIFFLIPLYLIYIRIQRLFGIQLVGSWTGLIITYVAFSLPLSIWILTGYFSAIPRDLEEAAAIDGLTEIGAFIRVVIPSNIGAIASVGVFASITSWSELLFASVLTTGPSQTLPVVLSGVSSAPGTVVHWNELMAAAIFASVPTTAAFYLVRRYFVTGLMQGAVKG